MGEKPWRSFSDSVSLSDRTAEALDALCIIAHVGRENVDMPSMLYLARVLREMPDNDRTFPRGKWATIQHIEGQVDCYIKEMLVEREKEMLAEREKEARRG